MSTSRRSFTRSIAMRLMLGTALVATFAFGLTAMIIYLRSSDALMSVSRANLENMANLEAQRISAEMGLGFESNDTLASSFLSLRQSGALTRQNASSVLQQKLLANPQWIGVGTLWEPDAFDGKDAEFVDTDGHDASGRFMSYWAWQDGTPVQEALRGYDVPGDGDWYLQPRASKKPAVLEPYSYEIGGRRILMTTLATPIVEGDHFLGVMTVDFALQSLQERLSTMHPMEQGYVRLLSPGGTIIADRDPAKVGSKVDDAATKAMLAGTAKGQVVFGQSRDAALGEDVVETYVPLKIGNAGHELRLRRGGTALAADAAGPRAAVDHHRRRRGGGTAAVLGAVRAAAQAGVPAPGAGRERVRPDRRRQAGQCPARPAR